MISTRLLTTNNTAIRITGIILIAANTEDAGVYAEVSAGPGAGVSGSAGVSFGTYRSLEDAQGPYVEAGVSGGPEGVSVGADVVANLEGDVIGGNVTAGVGAGTPLEGHVRIGVTGMVSFKDIMALIWSGDE